MSQEQSNPCSGIHAGGHTFHIPVMGTGFTIDTPLKVARYGISSVVSIVDDILIEKVRKFHCEKENEEYIPIGDRDEDSRARRITAYLNLLKKIIERQVAALKASLFIPGSEITRYFELLPEGCLKSLYHQMLSVTDGLRRKQMEDHLRSLANPGGIDVNIMTKLDRDHYQGKEKLPPEHGDAMAALRGFALSDLSSAVVMSAGMNQRLYGYLGKFNDFFPNEAGALVKKVIIKVSDFRSAEIQGKFLAKRGLWVSEFRIESGLNCGGHAFATKGHLLGPILEEFKQRRHQLAEELHGVYAKALATLGRPAVPAPLDVKVTVQGGIGTAVEDAFLFKHYEVNGTGWATPFLLVPEATNVDEEHIKKLCAATDEDVYLSDSSPLGVPFWNLRNSASELHRECMVIEGKPGSNCPKKILVSNVEFTPVPICLASDAYQKRKLASIDGEHTPEQSSWLKQYVLGKSCLCRDLSGGFEKNAGINEDATTAVCCGPNIVNFSRIATLEEMIGHIYGRISLLTNPDRPHMFLKELKIYIDYLRKEVDKYLIGLSHHSPSYFDEFKEALAGGIEYYRNLVQHLDEVEQPKFLEKLAALAEELEWTQTAVTASPSA